MLLNCQAPFGVQKWTHWGLNPGPSACGADVIPLHHVPVLAAPPTTPTPAIAQLVEHLTVEPCSNQMVPGSIPGGRNSCANAHPMAASNLRRICETSRHRGSNPGRSGGGRVSPPTRLERNFWMSSVRVGGVRGMMVVFIACVVEWLRRSQLTL